MARANRAIRHIQDMPQDREQRARAKREDTLLWKKYIPMTVKKAGAILGRDLPGHVRFSMELNADGSASFCLFDKEGVFSDSREVDFEKGVLLPGYVECSDQGRGIGRTMLRNQIEFFRACGIRRFKITAGLEAGGYSWARFGFLPRNIEGPYFKQHTREHVRERYKLIENLLTGEEKGKLKDIIRLRRLKDIWRLADAPVDVGPRLNVLFNKSAARATRADDPMRTLFNLLASSDKASKMIRRRMEQGESVSVGRLCLSGASWDGILNFDNKEQMRRAGDYVGGWSRKTASAKGRRP
jgi:hypothetical protein